MSTIASLVALWSNRTEVIDQSADVPYMVDGAATEAAVYNACDDIPSTYASDTKTLTLKSKEISEQISAMRWRVLARYELPTWSATENPDPRWSFDTGGGTQHITQSLATVASYGPKKSSAHKGAIGWTDKGIEGTDIVVPLFKWSETHYFDYEDVDQAYKLAVAALTGRTNNAEFRGFPTGEVLFMGASGQRQGEPQKSFIIPNGPWEITFNFAQSPNLTGLTIGGITGIAKAGWDYIWVQYDSETDETAKKVLKTPTAVYVERVYNSGDFSTLNLGAM